MQRNCHFYAESLTWYDFYKFQIILFGQENILGEYPRVVPPLLGNEADPEGEIALLCGSASGCVQYRLHKTV